MLSEPIKTLDVTTATLAGITETLNKMQNINNCIQNTEINAPNNKLNKIAETKSNDVINNGERALILE